MRTNNFNGDKGLASRNNNNNNNNNNYQFVNQCGGSEFASASEVLDYLKSTEFNYSISAKGYPTFRGGIIKNNDGYYNLVMFFNDLEEPAKSIPFGQRITLNKVEEALAIMQDYIDNNRRGLYFWNQHEQRFEGQDFQEWRGYEPMIETASNALTLIKENNDYKTIWNIREAFKLTDDLYGFSPMETIYHKNISVVVSALTEVIENMMYLETAEDKQERKKLKNQVDHLLMKSEVLIKSLAEGVVSLNGTKSSGSPYFHLTDPSQDIYTYNGRDFYMWDGWYSSKNVMIELADKQFNK